MAIDGFRKKLADQELKNQEAFRQELKHSGNSLEVQLGVLSEDYVAKYWFRYLDQIATYCGNGRGGYDIIDISFLFLEERKNKNRNLALEIGTHRDTEYLSYTSFNEFAYLMEFLEKNEWKAKPELFKDIRMGTQYAPDFYAGIFAAMGIIDDDKWHRGPLYQYDACGEIEKILAGKGRIRAERIYLDHKRDRTNSNPIFESTRALETVKKLLATPDTVTHNLPRSTGYSVVSPQAYLL